VNPVLRGGPFWTPITPPEGSFFHAETQPTTSFMDPSVLISSIRSALHSLLQQVIGPYGGQRGSAAWCPLALYC
jgi:hypothetical protein